MVSESRARKGRRSVIVTLALTTAGVCLAGGSMASAGSSGASGGGVTAPKPPALTGVSCVDRCAGLREAAPGASVELAGRRLGSVVKVKFPTKGGSSMVNPADVASRHVEAKVPDDASDGKLRVIDEFGQIAKAPEPLEIISESALPAPGSFRLADVSVAPEKAYFFGAGKPTLHYVFNGSGATDVRIDLVDQDDGAVVRSWVEEGVEPNSEQTLPWDGLGEDGKAAKSGEYRFQIGGVGDTLDEGGPAFGYYDHKYPVRGKHTYGDGTGAGRGHQGQDVFADCGTPLEAARGGKVQFSGFHGSAGNYVVIDGKKTGRDYVYMHLKRKAEVSEGDRVKTGQQLGLVGDTGNASGCHLHFELWSPPGWYEGGNFLSSVTRQLKKWDKWS